MRARYFLLTSCLILTACTHSIHMVNINGLDRVTLPEETTKVVEATAEQDVILFFAKDTDYVDEAHEKLLAKCKGELTAVSTQFSTSHGFLRWQNKILMKGICIPKPGS